MNYIPTDLLIQRFGDRIRWNEPLARYTSARVGGSADALIVAHRSDELAEIVLTLWQEDIPYLIIGGGSNILVSDAGLRGVVVLNQARHIQFDQTSTPPTVWVESGVNLGALARQSAVRGYSGLEWAAGIPGTVGGAVVGNAGAHGGDMAGNLIMAEILHRNQVNMQNIDLLKEQWTVDRFEYAYRSSRLKRQPGDAIVLAARLLLGRSTSQDVQAKMDEFNAYRRRTQPPGASMGSMFKNPGGEYAGRLIERAGLKGARIGDAEISVLHGNFFINHGQASAADIFNLISLARQKVAEKFGVNLELEIEMVGDWETQINARSIINLGQENLNG